VQEDNKKPNVIVGFSYIYTYNNKETDMKIKESQLRELFKEVGLSEDMFDIFRSKRKKLDRKIKDLKSDLKDMEDSAPTDKDRERLRKLNSTLQTALKSGGLKI